MAYTPSLNGAKKFYFLDYIYVLLESVRRFSEREEAFHYFKVLKNEYGLGESKYRKLDLTNASNSKRTEDRYRYTFNQVLMEAKDFELVTEAGGQLRLTNHATALHHKYDPDDTHDFCRALFVLTENKYSSFKSFLTYTYEANKTSGGVLIIPNYSPGALNIGLYKMADIIEYIQRLSGKISEDAQEYLGKHLDLIEEQNKLLAKLREAKLISGQGREDFDRTKINVVTKRIRDYWANYFLKNIYLFPESLTTFDIWCFRGKQFGVLHATEFYPHIHGKLIFPTAIVSKSSKSYDFEPIHTYNDGSKMFVHSPLWETFTDEFVRLLEVCYIELRRKYRNTFVPIPSLKELVCYRLRISERLFRIFLEKAYQMNLANKLQVKISLEVDRLPEDTNLSYLKREPLKIDGRLRSIIAIDRVRKTI